MARKEDFEYVLLEDLPVITSHFNMISADMAVATQRAAEHVGMLKDKHNAINIAQAQSTELAKLTKRLDSFFVKDIARGEEMQVSIPRKDVFSTKEDKEYEATGRQAMRNIQHNLEELKKHLNLL